MALKSFHIRHCDHRQVHAVEACSSQRFARHTHEGYGIGLIVGGAQRSWSGRGSVEAGPGDIITVNPGEVHDGAPIGERRSWKMLYLEPTLVAAVLNDAREGGNGEVEFSAPVLVCPRKARQFAELYMTMTEPNAGAKSPQEHLILLLAELFCQATSSESAALTPPVAAIRTRIEDAPHLPHPLADLAHDAGLSQFHLIRAFAKLTGFTPHAYVVQQRLASARGRITRGEMIADVAISCGFADQSHLTRAFVRAYGITPGAFSVAVR